MKKIFISLVLLSAYLLPGIAQQRSEAEAEAIAKAFMQNNGYDFNTTQSAKIKKVRTEKAGEITPYFIFNDTQKGGFVIVGGQEGMSDILAYSNDNNFDIDNIPPSAAAWLEIYTSAAKKAADYPEESKAEKKAAAKAFLNSNFALRKNVQPLLGEIKFNQGNPYNLMCPILTQTIIENGTESKRSARSVTGAVQTAQAMIMRYWKWPIRPTGKKTYTFNYESNINRDEVNENGNYKVTYEKYTLSIDFDQEPNYDWENMLPRYESVTRTSDEALRARQDTAVARLMAHCGISNSAGYGLGGTGAALQMNEMAKYFGYAKDYISDSYSNWQNDNEYRAMLADELSQGRPIWAAGLNENVGSHSYVCDGFDMNGLFHFNLGWNGSSNGYYEVAPTPQVPYGSDMWFHRNIHPEGRLTPTEPTRRIVFEIPGGSDWNKKYSAARSAINILTSSSKFSETVIPIITADTEEDAENYHPGLSSVAGILVNRCDTVTGTINATTAQEAYERNIKRVAPALIDIDAVYTSDTTMAVNVATQFTKSYTNANFRIKFVYTENNGKIGAISYPYLMRGSYLGKEDYLPSTIEQDKQYVYEDVIPFPKNAITRTQNTTLIVMLIDEKTGEIANANLVDLKQIDTWESNNGPAFYCDGAIQESSSETTTYYFDSKNSRMAIPVRIDNPWYKTMTVEVSAEAVELAENAQVQLGETEGTTNIKYNLIAHDVDSTLNLYLNITDTLQSSFSSVKLILKQNAQMIAEQIVNFEFIGGIEGINAYTVREKGTLESLVPKEVRNTMSVITLGGRICGNDIIFMRDSLKLDVIDMSKARIVEGPGKYNSNYTTTDDVVGTRLFQGVNVQKVILPESAKEIADYAFNLNKTVSSVIIGENVTSIGNSAFNGCIALETLTIPASVTEAGRNAFKGTGLKCVICKGETPAKLGTLSFSGVDVANATLVVPNEAAVAAYKAASQWKNFGNIIEAKDFDEIETVYTLSISGENGTFSGAGEYMAGTAVQLTAVPDTGYVFSGWYEGGNLLSIEPEFTYTITGNVSLVAKFEQMKDSPNTMGVKALRTFPGSTLVIPVEMNNAEDITAFQFDLYLPNGININTDEEGELMIALDAARKTSSHTLSYSQLSNGAIRVVAYSSSNKPFRGSEGALVNITTTIPVYMSTGDYQLTMKDIRLANTNEEEFVTVSKTSTISISTMRGDVNMDFNVTISDVVAVVNYILDKPTKVFNFMAADVTGDDKVSISDIVGIVNIILNPETEYSNGYNAKRAANDRSGDSTSMGEASAEAGSVAIPVSLNNANEYTAFQMDVELPEGATLASATLGSRAASSHSITWKAIADNKVRVVAYSVKNATFAGNAGELVTLNIEAAEGATGAVAVDNVRMATAEGVEMAVSGCGANIDINGTTGIGSIDAAMFKAYAEDGTLVVESGKEMQLSVYAANGRLVKIIDVTVGKNKFYNFAEGVYVINGVKVIVK